MNKLIPGALYQTKEELRNMKKNYKYPKDTEGSRIAKRLRRQCNINRILQVEPSKDNRAIYIRLKRAEIFRTIPNEMSGITMVVDYDEDMDIVGVELLLKHPIGEPSW